jgi:hypothetical protein
VLARNRFREPKLTVRQRQQYALVNRALDAATEFGIESASRERLLTLVGELTGTLRAIREGIVER